ncbi:hypothetical protein Bxe_A1923 [Paraburkholderia xenovorans LB400]|uniref:Uncharacterized protein n=1 Tax=Paraburkholderia xenovorans (strain LB400) TaxID=266265 RepID=Q13XZ7_PARXL|nr:hypothetical protein Bxe_A1923 [Paraburkholderia xenovorans LB400]
MVGRATDVSVLKYLWLSHRRQPRTAGDALLLLQVRLPAADTRAQAGSAHAEPPCNALIRSVQFNSVRRAPLKRARRPPASDWRGLCRG